MKKLLSIIAPSIIIYLVVLSGIPNKGILLGLYLIVPLIFIIQGIMYSNIKRELIIGFTLSSLSFLISINLFYSMGSCIELAVFYNVLGIISFLGKNIIKNRKLKN